MADILIDMFQGGLASLADYMAAHVLTCLVPAFFIAGAIAVFISRQAVLKYFGSDVKKYISYAVASVSGTILAVCSCTILPLFAGIYKRGAGIGPATAFLYSGPAINVLAIVYTGQALGYDLGLARAVAAISMASVVGLIMSSLFDAPLNATSKGKKPGKEGRASSSADAGSGKDDSAPGISIDEPLRPALVVPLFFIFMVLILVIGASTIDWLIRLPVVLVLIAGVIVLLIKHFDRDEVTEWGYETWDLTKKIFPVLLIGAFIVGVIAVVLPPETFRPYLGDNSIIACFLGSVIGTLLYIPTLLEVPIIGSTFGYTSGMMAGGPALSLLLAGPAVSLPSLVVLQRIMGTKKTTAFALVVVLTSTIAGFVYGNLFT